MVLIVSPETTEACPVTVRGPPQKVSVSGDDPVPRWIAVRRTVGVTLAASISPLPPTSVFSEVFLGRRPMAQKR